MKKPQPVKHYRSTLEATWGVLMRERLHWNAEHEPHKLHGYIPDFLVHLERPFYVEVKPLRSTAEFKSFCAADRKICNSGAKHPVIVVGLYPRRFKYGEEDWDFLGALWLPSKRAWKIVVMGDCLACRKTTPCSLKWKLCRFCAGAVGPCRTPLGILFKLAMKAAEIDRMEILGAVLKPFNEIPEFSEDHP